MKENLKNSNGVLQKVKKLSKGLAKAIFKDEEKKIVIPEFSQNVPFMDMTNTSSMGLENNLITEPVNASGVWGIFDGTFKLELENRTENLPDIQLLTCANWKRVTTFPKLPIVPAVRDTISETELVEFITMAKNGMSTETTRILPGVVSCKGLSRLSLNSLLIENKGEEVMNTQTFYKLDYGKTTTLVFIPKALFQNEWFSVFDNADQIKSMDNDFYFMIITKEIISSLTIKPFIAETNAQSFNLEDIKYSNDENVRVRRKACTMNDLLKNGTVRAK